MVLATNWTNVFIMTGIGIGIVFVILVLLVFILQLFNYVATRSTAAPAVKAAPAAPAGSDDSLDYAAVAMALNLYFNEVHDEESYRLTIHHNEHSAWNSEINNINNLVK